MLKYRIMKKLCYDKPISIPDLAKLLGFSENDRADYKIALALKELASGGYIKVNKQFGISLNEYISLREYRRDSFRRLLVTAGSIASIVAAITGIASVLISLLR